MTDERDQNPETKKRELAMAARATIELFGNGAIAKTKRTPGRSGG